MKGSRPGLAGILDRLEAHYGEQAAVGPSNPYEMILLVNCGIHQHSIEARRRARRSDEGAVGDDMFGDTDDINLSASEVQTV